MGIIAGGHETVGRSHRPNEKRNARDSAREGGRYGYRALVGLGWGSTRILPPLIKSAATPCWYCYCTPQHQRYYHNSIRLPYCCPTARQHRLPFTLFCDVRHNLLPDTLLRETLDWYTLPNTGKQQLYLLHDAAHASTNGPHALYRKPRRPPFP